MMHSGRSVRILVGLLDRLRDLTLRYGPFASRLQSALAGLRLLLAALTEGLHTRLGVLPVRLEHERTAQLVSRPTKLAVVPAGSAHEVGQLLGADHQEHHHADEQDLGEADAQQPASRRVP